MVPRFAVLCLLVLFPTATLAQQPEELLSVRTQLYLRWDGVEKHRPAYAQTALGKMLQGDTGRFLDNVLTQLQSFSGTFLTSDQLFQGVPPDVLRQLRAEAALVPQLLPLLAKHGFVLGVEMHSVNPPAGQVTVIVPEIGAQPGPLFGTLRLVSRLLKQEIHETKIAGRTVQRVEAGPIQLAWWTEGAHALLTVGTDHPQAFLKRLQESGARLSASPLFKKLQGFNQFETAARAYLDLGALVKLAQGQSKEMTKLMTDLGLDQLQSWTMVSGFAGDTERSVSELTVPGGRRGLLRLVHGKPFKFSDLPPIAPDAASWSAINFNLGILYDTGVEAAESILTALAPQHVSKVKEYLLIANGFLGIDLRQDLLSALGDQTVQYNSPAEGPLSFGQTFLIKVKDAKKVQASLEQMLKSVLKLAGLEASVKRYNYRGVTLHELHVRRQGFLFVPTFAIQNDWLVFSYFPQPVEGFVLRATGALPRWQPEHHVQAALNELPKECIALSVSDPRPSLTQLLSLAPMAGGALKSFLPDSSFEVDLIPNPHEATQHLFPNVSVVSDNGTTLRSETRASLQFPIELTGLDTYALFFVAFGAISRGF